MKRIPAVLLALAVIFLLGGAALAEGDTYSASHGVVTQVDTEAQTMTIRLGGREEGTLTLDISEETKIVDNASRTACKLSDIKAGSTVYVWHTAGQSSFLPPHRKAYAIVANVAADQTAGQLFEIASVSKGKNGYTLLNAEGDLYLTVPDASIPVYGQSAKLRASKLEKGMVLLAWYDVVLESYPGQAGSDRLLMLSTAAGGDSVLPQHEKVEPPFQHPHAGIAERPADAAQERLPHQAAEGNRRFRLQRNQENQREAERNDGERQQIEVVDEQADQREKNGQTDASG